LETTAPAPTTAPLPIVTPGSTVEPWPIQTAVGEVVQRRPPGRMVGGVDANDAAMLANLPIVAHQRLQSCMT
jgi:hypothetical protein